MSMKRLWRWVVIERVKTLAGHHQFFVGVRHQHVCVRGPSTDVDDRVALIHVATLILLLVDTETVFLRILHDPQADATAVLARLFILDEQNAEGRALEAEILEHGSKAAYEVEDKIAEAVQWMESGRLEDAESNLRRVLDISPAHQEAEHYLEQVLQRMEEASSAGEEPAAEPADSNMDHGAVYNKDNLHQHYPQE